MTTDADSLIGQTLGSYQITALRWGDPHRQVYDAWHLALDRTACIALIDRAIFANAPNAETRFQQEVQQLATLNHPNLITIYDFGRYQEAYFLITAEAKGQHLATLLEKSLTQRLEIVSRLLSGLAAGLDAAHEHGVVHRQLTPASIFVQHNAHVTITDFGFGLDLVGESAETTRSLISDAYYLSPEQAINADEASSGSDIYALGCILFEVLAGRPPFADKDPLAVALQHVNDVPPRITAVAPELPATLDPIFQRALSKKPAQRYPSVTALTEDLQQALAAPVPRTSSMTHNLPGTSTLGPPRVQARPTGQRHLIVAAILLTGLLVLSVGVIVSLLNNNNLVAQGPDSDGSNLPPTQQSAKTIPPTMSIPGSPTPTMTPSSTPTTAFMPSPTPALQAESTATPTTQPPPLPSATTTATPLSPTSTPTPAEASQPEATPTPLSPLAALRGQILFKTDRAGRVEIYRMNPDGSDQQVLPPEQAALYNEAVRWEAFSANQNETVVVRGQGQPDLWLVNLGTGQETRLTSNGAADYDPVWSPVANQIAFVSERTGNGDLYLLSLTDSQLLRLTLNEGDYDKHPSWAQDGTQIVYWSNRGGDPNRQIWRYDLVEGTEINLSNNQFRDWDPVWVK